MSEKKVRTSELEEKVKEFEGLFQHVKREGADKLLAFIQKSDFYTAPASTRYHSCHEGGLLEHSLNVYQCLIAKINNPVWKPYLENLSEETLIISALCHDLCKTYFYVPEYRNKKVYNENGKKEDAGGKFDWQTVQGYSIDDKIPYGHGEKSVMMIEEYLKLKPVERYAIRFHMGWSEPKELYNALGSAMEKYPLVIALHEADQEATYLFESKE